MKEQIKLSKAEIQSGSSRVKRAEGLIKQLPKGHDGRNTWLMNYGHGEDAETIRNKHNFDKALDWDEEHDCLKSANETSGIMRGYVDMKSDSPKDDEYVLVKKDFMNQLDDVHNLLYSGAGWVGYENLKEKPFCYSIFKLFSRCHTEEIIHKDPIPRILGNKQEHESEIKQEYKIHTTHINGNKHDAATYINKMGWADYLIEMEKSGYYTIIVFRMPTELVHKIREEDISFVSEVDHDDYTG